MNDKKNAHTITSVAFVFQWDIIYIFSCYHFSENKHLLPIFFRIPIQVCTKLLCSMFLRGCAQEIIYVNKVLISSSVFER